MLLTKVIPFVLAVCNLINTIISYFDGNYITMNYIANIGIIPLVYLYYASYTFKLCEYYRMSLHYIVVINLINIYDYYIGIPISDVQYFTLGIGLFIITMLVIIYLKFFKK